MDSIIQPTETNQTLFNAGVAKLMRIDNQWKLAQYSRIQKDYVMLSDSLLNIRTEINQKLNPEERNKCIGYEQSMKTELDALKYKHKISLTPFREFELYLGDLEFKYGYSMPDKEKKNKPKNF